MQLNTGEIDKNQLFNLITGVLGIYILYFFAGFFHEALVTKQFTNISTGQQKLADFPLGLVIVPFLIAWIIADIYNRFFLQERVRIPKKNSILCGGAMAFTSVLSIIAIMFTNYPVVIMFESCNVLSVVLVAVFCSRVREERLKLGRKKIVVAAVISVGILMFEFFNPKSQKKSKESSLIGFGALSIWIVAEGFFPDLQAQIKSKFKPMPTEMMAEINKWGSILILVLMLVSWRIWDFLDYMFFYPLFTFYLVFMSVISAFGQFFVYRMIKQFKQHVLPFTVTTRKIFSVLLSIIFYKHETNFFQIFGIFLVFGTVVYDFITQITKKQTKITSEVKEEDSLKQETDSQRTKQNLT